MTIVSDLSKGLLTATALITMSQAGAFASAQDAVSIEAEAASETQAETPVDAPSVETEAPTETAPAEDITPEPAVDYSMMNKFMTKLSVNERGRPALAYKVIRDKAMPVLDEYEAELISVDVESLNDDDRLAYWLNLQNLLVIKAVATDTKKTNLKSLRGTGKKPGKLWTKDRITLNGQSYSIADIEAKIISDFKDPNVIYGLYQGVKGGPCLSETAYEGPSVSSRLAELGMRYVNSRGIVSPSKGIVTVTPIYDWHKTALFGGDDKAILKHLKGHANTALRGRLNTGREIKFTKLNYVTDNYIVPKDVRASAPRRQAPPAPVPTQQQQRQRGGGFGS